MPFHFNKMTIDFFSDRISVHWFIRLFNVIASWVLADIDWPQKSIHMQCNEDIKLSTRGVRACKAIFACHGIMAKLINNNLLESYSNGKLLEFQRFELFSAGFQAISFCGIMNGLDNLNWRWDVEIWKKVPFQFSNRTGIWMEKQQSVFERDSCHSGDSSWLMEW